MSQLQRIVVGHDFKAGGEIAVSAAATLAKRCGAALKLVHAIEPYHLYQRVSHPLTSTYTTAEIAQRAGKTLEAVATSPELAHLHVEYEVRTGKPFVELIITCRAWQGNLIVVGVSTERDGGLLGSTSERVLRKALVPVLVVKKPLPSQPQTFLVPTDFSACSKKAAEEALTLAHSLGGRVVFHHALDLSYLYTASYGFEPAVPSPVGLIQPADLESEWQAFLSGLPWLDNVSWTKHTEEGRPGATIVRRAEEIQADLIVMGTHGRSGLTHMLLGSVAEHVVRAASCSVLTIRPDAFQFELP